MNTGWLACWRCAMPSVHPCGRCRCRSSPTGRCTALRPAHLPPGCPPCRPRWTRFRGPWSRSAPWGCRGHETRGGREGRKVRVGQGRCLHTRGGCREWQGKQQGEAEIHLIPGGAVPGGQRWRCRWAAQHTQAQPQALHPWPGWCTMQAAGQPASSLGGVLKLLQDV